MIVTNMFGIEVDLVDHTSTINALPNYYDSITKLNLFKPDRVASQNYTIDVQENPYALVPTQEWGQNNYSLVVNSKRKLNNILILPLTTIEKFLFVENSGIQALDTSKQYMPTVIEIERKLQELKNRIDIIRECRYMGVLKGKVLDADGVTELYDLYDFFKATKKVLEFKLSDDECDVAAKCLELKRHINKHARGETFSSIHVLVSSEFFDAFVQHPKVKEAYMYQSEESNRLGYDIQKDFRFQGIVFEDYNTTVIDKEGKAVPILPGATGVAFPLGTNNTFIEAIAPAISCHYISGSIAQTYYSGIAQTYYSGIAQTYYSWSEVSEKSYLLKVESNTLPLVLRPELIVEVKAI